MSNPKVKLGKTVPFTMASERIKCSRANLIKEAEDLQTKKYKILLRKIEELNK